MEEYRCVVCNSTFDRQNKLDIHMITKKHIMNECKNANIEQMKERYCTVKKDKLESDRMVRKLQIDIKTIKEENIHIQKESARKLKEESIRIRDESAKKIMRKAIGKIVTVPQALAFPISPQSIRVSSYNKPDQMVLLGKSY